MIPNKLLLWLMKGKWLGVPLIILLLSASLISFFNQDQIEDWLQNNSITITKEEINTLGIQQNEHWPVLIVNFQDEMMDANSAVTQAEQLLVPHSQDYFSQLSNDYVNLSIDIHQTVAVADGDLADYGGDNGVERDSSDNGLHLPMNLASEVINSNKNQLNWSKYDLNSDGYVDRLLILHTTVGQEVGGNSDRIWSHYTTLDEIIDLGGGMKIGHYTMAGLGSGQSGFGTAMHEMLHQMGAYDLYPSHGQQSSLWKGVGDWGIMASGNWNGGGSKPALPMSSTMETIGLDNYQVVDLSWIQDDGFCQGPELIFDVGQNSNVNYKIMIGQDEYVWIEYRGNNVYDNLLPANGILVSYQDSSVDGFDDNELNIDNQRPYLKIIEADGRQDLLQGMNEGDASDVFTNGTTFGSKGVEIRNHDGFLVDWYAEVSIAIKPVIKIKSDSCQSELTGNLPDHSITMLINESIEFSLLSTIDCQISNQLQSTDGRLVAISDNELYAGVEKKLTLTFNSVSNPNSLTKLTGKLVCGAEVLDVDTQILTLSRIPTNGEYKSVISANSDSEILIPIKSTGQGSQTFEVHIDGALTRIAASSNTITLDGEDDLLSIDISHNNLLSNNMLVNGHVEIEDSAGNSWVIDIELTAESDGLKSINDFIGPGQMISLALLFGALWVYLTMRESAAKGKRKDDEEDIKPSVVIEDKPLDAWGRPLDD